jgi:hypothetical protein
MDSEPLKPVAPLLERVILALERYSYRFSSELKLHAGIAQALTLEGFAFEQERRPTPACRYDFYLPEGSIVIEAKVHGSYAAALRQVERYLQLPDCNGAIIASTKAWASTATAQMLHGKPMRLARLRPKVF